VKIEHTYDYTELISLKIENTAFDFQGYLLHF